MLKVGSKAPAFRLKSDEGKDVGVVDLEAHRQVAEIDVGLHPSDLQLTRDGRILYVANANSDTVSAIDTQSRRVIETINIRPDPSLPFGSAPNALALSADESRLFVANGGNNAIAVVKLSPGGSQIEGFIPTDWYPGALATDGQSLFVAHVISPVVAAWIACDVDVLPLSSTASTVIA